MAETNIDLRKLKQGRDNKEKSFELRSNTNTNSTIFLWCKFSM